MTERERLYLLSELTPAEILNAFRNRYYTDGNNTENGIVANAINDILPRMILPPCKVGQTVYVPWRYAFQRGIAIVEVKEIKLYDTDPSHCMFLIDMESDNECFNQSFGGWKTEKSIGKTVFLTREEAEKALAERSEP